MCFFFRVFAMSLRAPVYMCLVVTCSFVGLTVSLSLSHLCPGSGAVLDCIDS